MRSSAVYLDSNASLSIKNNRLDSYQNTAPVHWGVNATPLLLFNCVKQNTAPVHWGVNATS